jgi:putative hydrolase of the HAD superfamily
MKPKTLCFDLYGTLADIRTDESLPDAFEALTERCAAYGAVWQPEELRAFYESLGAVLHDVAEAQPGWAELDYTPLFARLLTEKGAQATPEAVADLAWTFRRATTLHLELYPGAADFLKKARAAGFRCVLASNAQKLFTRPELELLGLNELLDVICISSEEGFKKPDHRFYAAVLAKADTKPAEAMMIGNDAVCDVAGAVEAGLTATYFYTALSPVDDPCHPPLARYSFDGPNYAGLAEALGINH